MTAWRCSPRSRAGVTRAARRGRGFPAGTGGALASAVALVAAFGAGLPAHAAPAASGGAPDTARAQVAQAPWTVRELFAAFARAPRRDARFVERRFLAVLDAPIDARGELRFVPPAHLEKYTLAPARERLIVDGDTLTVERDGLVRTTTLRELPEIAPIVTGLRATLAGDLGALEREFDLRARGDAAAWTVRLAPRNPAAARAVATITLRGAGFELQVIDIELGDGDRTVMRVLP